MQEHIHIKDLGTMQIPDIVLRFKMYVYPI